MWHLFKNSEGKYEFAFVNKGKYIAGTNQGYEKKKAALRSFYSLAMFYHSDEYKATRVGFNIQDDTLGLVLCVWKDGTVDPRTDIKLNKPYKP